jgi:hypothetical protein
MRATLSRRTLLRSLFLAPVAATASAGLGGLPVAAATIPTPVDLPPIVVGARADGLEVVNESVTTGGAALWQGFDHRWRSHPHRVNRFGSWLQEQSVQIGGTPPVATVSGERVSHMRYGDTNGGDIVDTAVFAAPLMFTDQPSALTCLHGAASIEFSAARGVRSSLLANPLEQILPAGVTATAVLRGFDIVCLNAPNEGFHTRGFGFGIRDLTVTPVAVPTGGQVTKLSFRPEFMIWPDRSPDTFNIGPDAYTYRLTMFYTVLWAPIGRLKVAFGSYDSGELVDVDASASPIRAFRSIAGQAGGVFPRSALGLRGFQFELPEHKGTVHDGRYLRHLRFFVEPAGYSAQTGAADYYANVFFTNIREAAPRWSYDFDIRFTLDSTLIQFVSPVGSAQRRFEQVIDPADDDQVEQPFTLGGYLAG